MESIDEEDDYSFFIEVDDIKIATKDIEESELKENEHVDRQGYTWFLLG